VVADLQRSFNAEFQSFMDKKKALLDRIAEKNVRINEIIAELRLANDTQDLQLGESEIADTCLNVKDEEVGVEKVLSEEEKNRIEQERLEAEARARGAKDDSAERGLIVMMDGKLEEDDQKVRLFATFERPEWMTRPVEEMSEDEVKEMKAWDAWVAEQKAEQEMQKKALEGELKKLRSETQTICAGFDESLQELFDKRVKNDQLIFEHELYLIKLYQSVQQAEDDEAKAIELGRDRDKYVQLHKEHQIQVDSAREAMDKVKLEYDEMARNEKELDKAFKRDVCDQDQYGDLLYKLYRRRPKKTKHTSHNEEFRVIDAESLLDEEEDRPEMLEDGTWQRLIEAMNVKLELEEEMRTKNISLHELQKHYNRVAAEDEELGAKVVHVEEELRQLNQLRARDTLDLDMVLKLKQGQVEVEQAAVVTDYADSILVHRRVIEDVNQVIVQLGTEKLKILEEIKEKRKGIHRLRWEKRRAEFEEEELIRKTREFQLLRVTKNLQEILKNGGENNKSASETQVLEKRLELNMRTHADKIDDLNKHVNKIQLQMKEMHRENEELDEDIAQLESAVSERVKLYTMHADRDSGSGPKEQRARIRDITAYRRLIDLARAQTNEIEAMREELVRLRARTFPSFAQLQDARVNPDQRQYV
jgi:hypothetical protein